MSKLRWQCRRGMRELDVLLEGYLDAHYDAAPDEEKRAFESLLRLSDPELVSYLLHGERAEDPAMERLFSRLRG